MDRLPNETLDNAISVYKTTIKVVEENKDSDYCTTLDKATLALLEELKEYRDAEEQGLLHKAPLKNGTLIWFFRYGYDEGTYLTSGTYLYGVTEYEIGEFKKDFWLSEEDALFAREEAEQASAERKGV